MDKKLCIVSFTEIVTNCVSFTIVQTLISLPTSLRPHIKRTFAFCLRFNDEREVVYLGDCSEVIWSKKRHSAIRFICASYSWYSFKLYHCIKTRKIGTIENQPWSIIRLRAKLDPWGISLSFKTGTTTPRSNPVFSHQSKDSGVMWKWKSRGENSSWTLCSWNPQFHREPILTVLHRTTDGIHKQRTELWHLKSSQRSITYRRLRSGTQSIHWLLITIGQKECIRIAVADAIKQNNIGGIMNTNNVWGTKIIMELSGKPVYYIKTRIYLIEN